jgi:hypothetical protein
MGATENYQIGSESHQPDSPYKFPLKAAMQDAQRKSINHEKIG